MKRKSKSLQVRSFDYDVKSVNDKGVFSGYGSVFGNVDSYLEVVEKGAFVKSLDVMRSKGRTFPVLWQHRSGEPIGNWDIDSMLEDDHGLFGEGQLWLDDAPYAKVAHRGMASKAITGLSIGYYVVDSEFDDKTRIRKLKELELVEISIVTNPANEDARIDAVKAMIAHGTLPSLKEFEQILREAGFSKSQSVVIANHGLANLLQSESEEQAIVKSVASLLAGRKPLGLLGS